LDDAGTFGGGRVALVCAVNGLYDINAEAFARILNDEPGSVTRQKPGTNYDAAESLQGLKDGVFYHELGDGVNVLERGNTRKISFGRFIRSSDVEILRSDSDLVFSVSGTADRVSIRGWFDEPEAFDISRTIEVSFPEETIDVRTAAMTARKFEPPVRVVVYPAINYILGSDEDQYLIGSKDTDNTIISNPGNDVIVGNGGNNIFYYAMGLGNDTIVNKKRWGEYGTLRFDSDITSADVTVSRSGDDVVFLVGDGSVTVRDWFKHESFKLDNVGFFDGEVWDALDVEKLSAGIPLSEREYIYTTPEYDR
jgi:Ca2+-binding RTX toxin-like protein